MLLCKIDIYDTFNLYKANFINYFLNSYNNYNYLKIAVY